MFRLRNVLPLSQEACAGWMSVCPLRLRSSPAQPEWLQSEFTMPWGRGQRLRGAAGGMGIVSCIMQVRLTTMGGGRGSLARFMCVMDDGLQVQGTTRD